MSKTQTEQLQKILPPPAVPLEVPTSEEWSLFEKEFVALPSDYKNFIEIYGTGSIDSFLWVFNPASRNNYFNLKFQLNVILDGLRDSRKKFGEFYQSINFYPESCGLLPFANTENGDNLFWFTRGVPDHWSIGIMGPRSTNLLTYEYRFSTFLISLIQRDFICPLFPDDFPSSPPVSFEID